MPPATVSAFPPAKRRVNPMVQQGDEGLLRSPANCHPTRNPPAVCMRCIPVAGGFSCGNREIGTAKRLPPSDDGAQSRRIRRPPAEIPAPRRFPASLIGSGPLRRPQRRSLRGGNPHSAGNHRRRPAFPSPPTLFTAGFDRPTHTSRPEWESGIFPSLSDCIPPLGESADIPLDGPAGPASSSFKVVLRVL